MLDGNSVLFLGPRTSTIYRRFGAMWGRTENPLYDYQEAWRKYDWLVSHNYRHKVPAEVLAQFPKCAINCHISFLPWNRGSYPNVWSAARGTPSGVSIHRMTENFDEGPILAQWRVPFTGDETLEASYNTLQTQIADLFEEAWPAIQNRYLVPQPQPHNDWKIFTTAQFHELLEPHLLEGWQTTRRDLNERYIRSCEDSGGLWRG